MSESVSRVESSQSHISILHHRPNKKKHFSLSFFVKKNAIYYVLYDYIILYPRLKTPTVNKTISYSDDQLTDDAPATQSRKNMSSTSADGDFLVDELVARGSDDDDDDDDDHCEY